MIGRGRVVSRKRCRAKKLFQRLGKYNSHKEIYKYRAGRLGALCGRLGAPTSAKNRYRWGLTSPFVDDNDDPDFLQIGQPSFSDVVSRTGSIHL